jgi:hypothetical protein
MTSRSAKTKPHRAKAVMVLGTTSGGSVAGGALDADANCKPPRAWPQLCAGNHLNVSQ